MVVAGLAVKIGLKVDGIKIDSLLLDLPEFATCFTIFFGKEVVYL